MRVHHVGLEKVARDGKLRLDGLKQRYCRMLQKLSELVGNLHERAAAARERAEAAGDPASKAAFLEMERHWLNLAGNYEFAESLGSS
jgi:hypothetical protein